MLIKTDPDQIQGYLEDAANLPGGHAEQVAFPETAAEVAAFLAECAAAGTPVTTAGGGTGLAGGRIPHGGAVVATDRLNTIGPIQHTADGGRVTVGPGVVLADLQSAVEADGLFYPPDPTERSCFVGATVATNASGARTFKYGPTRAYVERLQLALSTGDVLDIRRGEHLSRDGRFMLTLPTSGRTLDIPLPTYMAPDTTKHAAGLYVAPLGQPTDLIDLVIGSEGILGVVTEIELRLLRRPVDVFSALAFFPTADGLLGFVAAARNASLATRSGATSGGLDARALEYFDGRALEFLRPVYSNIPTDAVGAVLIEQESSPEAEEALLVGWVELMEAHGALVDDSWFAQNAAEGATLRDFRHALPVRVNEWLAARGQSKISTDMAVPLDRFAEMLEFYEITIAESGLASVTWGHIGDAHLHVNLLPATADEHARGKALYARFVEQAIRLGGTVSAEHGIGRLKVPYLRAMMGDEALRQMAAVKRAFDPAGVLAPGVLLPPDLR